MQVINLFAGPGAGKSTTAAGLFYEMKIRGFSVELITEYAKDMTWERRFNIMADQLYMFAKQHRRQFRLRGQVDYIITDSPLLFSLVYVTEEYGEAFKQLVVDRFDSFNNSNFFIERAKPYVEVGRSQTEEEAREIDQEVARLLRAHEEPYTVVRGDNTAPMNILFELGL